MTLETVTYRAHTNIALIKYWGKRNADLFLPQTSSLSLTLDAFYTDTQVSLLGPNQSDQAQINGKLLTPNELAKLSRFVDLFRQAAHSQVGVRIDSTNHVPTAAGLASSASGFAALACGLNQLFDLGYSQQVLSTLARQGSGSASRSLFGGFVEWHAGQGDDSASSYAECFEPAQWDIGMLAILINAGPKAINSRQGMAHTLASSPFYQLWPQEVAKDLAAIKPAILAHDIDQVGQIAEHNAMKMHATMIAANPSFTYWEGDSLLAMQAVRQLRTEGFQCYFTMDAGPNVKVICPASQMPAIKDRLSQYFALDRLVTARPGPAPQQL